MALALGLFLATAYSLPTSGQQPGAPQGAPGQAGRGGPGGRPGGPGGRGQVQLAEGAGRDLVQATCSRCHGMNLIASSWGYTKDGWKDRIATIVALPAGDLGTITSYLAAS